MTSNRMSKEEVARRHAIYEREMAARKFEPWRRPENIPPGTPVKVRVLDKLYDGVMVRDVECGNLGPMLRIVSVKLVSESLGYSGRARRGEVKELRRYTPGEITKCFKNASIYSEKDSPEMVKRVSAYLNRRAEALEQDIAPNLMDRDEAKAVFDELHANLSPKCTLPMNKQKGDKRHFAYMVGIVNMLTEDALGGRTFDDNPRGLTIVKGEGRLYRTFSRWMDGAYPSRIDPLAVWEVKEYYGTTTFGSRVADGVYESMLDGEEMAELYREEGRKVYHYLIVDDRFTWWDCGRSYLCRIVDAMQMGLLDEALFGREVLKRWPEIVKTWP